MEQPPNGRDAVDQMAHAAMIAVLENGDAAISQNAMQEHIESMMEELMGMTEEQVRPAA
jgi:DNA-binding FadR family transcriptional regulator